MTHSLLRDSITQLEILELYTYEDFFSLAIAFSLEDI